MRTANRLVWMLLLHVATALASGPRFVTGPPFFTGQPGQAIGWKQSRLLYFTDPGPLSATVDHATADALVAAAAGVWNLPVASITIGKGGALAQHVSGQNAYLDVSGMAFPDDVMSTNAAAVPVAVLYDSDGSVTDLLLGSGASNPIGCRQNGVTDTVDSFDPAGYILHAIIVVNGRCTGAAPEMQLELQYQLMRAFGRVLGLAWSQTNDNVFTGSPAPTYIQAMNWPIMHPLDIICGPYTYQCLPAPFQLRPDDIASMVAVYPVAANPPPGKQPSLTDANNVFGHVYFPTGEGMAGVNILVKREPNAGTTFDSYWIAAGLSGTWFRSGGGSPFLPPGSSPENSFGTTDPNRLGAYSIAYVPVLSGNPTQNLMIATEPVNPLYLGSHSIGPNNPGSIAPSGTAVSQVSYGNGPGGGAWLELTIPDAASTCTTGLDGTVQSPSSPAPTGWWRGLLCGQGHVAYNQVAVQPGRTYTVEVTALDGNGLATETKAMPVIGLFAPGDGLADLPSLGVTDSAFNSLAYGMTTISASTAQTTTLRFGIADQRGDGRPDFSYQARLFYADSVLPEELGTAGGTITISGMGFRAGNAVTINGVSSTVLSSTANSIVVAAPSMAQAKATQGAPVDIAVSDRSTGAQSIMAAALTYTSAAALPNIRRLVSAQSASTFVGDVAATPFAVQVLRADGTTPVVAASVVFTAPTGAARLGACSAAACTVITDARGIASTTVTPLAAGPITLHATDGSLTQTASFTAEAQTGSLTVFSAPTGNLPIGVAAQTQIGILDWLPNNAGRSPGRLVTFTVLTGSAIFNGCATAVCAVTTDWEGAVRISVTPTALGAVTVQATDGDATATISFNAVSNTDVMTIASAPAPTTYIGNYIGYFTVNLFQPDGVTRDQNQTVVFTGPAGVVFDPCKSNVCSSSSGWIGQANVGIEATQPGTYTIQAAYGGATSTVTFSVVPHTVNLAIQSVPPAASAVGKEAAEPFAVRLLQDGVIPISGEFITLSGLVGEVSLGGCANWAPACHFVTDANGMASTTVTPLVPGAITLSAVYFPQVLSASFTAVGVGETMTILQQPPPTIFVGDTVNFAVRVLGPGGVAPMQGDHVLYSILGGSFGFSDWTSTSVDRQTDGHGDSFEVGVASAPGLVTVMASDGVTSQQMNFTAVARPDVLTVVSAPASGSIAGTQAATPFAVRVFSHDGVTPLAGRAVTIAVSSGAGSFSACAGAATCQIVTDAQGLATSSVTPLAAGTIILSATEGGVQQTASFIAAAPVAAPVLSLTALHPAIYVHAGSTISLTLNAAALYNGVPATSQATQWNLASGFASATRSTVTNTSGIASELVLLGPLLAGTTATATACAWGNVCAEFDGFGVAPASESIVIVSGGGQTASGGAALSPVILRVVDPTGNPVAAAPVSIYQTVSAWNGPCPSQGRCPASEVLTSQATVLVSGTDGMLTITPLTVPNRSTQTEIALSVGTQGFATVVEIVQP